MITIDKVENGYVVSVFLHAVASGGLGLTSSRGKVSGDTRYVFGTLAETVRFIEGFEFGEKDDC